MGQGQKIFEI